MELPTPPPNRTADAPTYALSREVRTRLFTTLEYPAPISLSQTSLSTALSKISPALDTLGDPDRVVELDLSTRTGQNPYLHKVPANSLATTNLVLRVTKRKRKVPRRDQHGNVIEEGQYKLEPFGVENRLIRFRAMADFQYIPKIEKSDRVVNLADAMRNLDTGTIRSFRMPEPSEDDFKSNPSGRTTSSQRDHLPPPPIFSRHLIPQNFDFRPTGGSVRITNEQGFTRLVNSTRYKVKTIQFILFVEPRVPEGPDETFLKELKRTEVNQVEKRLRDLLQHERPVWTRLALLNQLNRDELKYVSNNKSVWPMIGYTFSDGPFRDLVIRFGYDPRKDPQARFYQHIVLRNLQNVRSKALPGTRNAVRETTTSGTRGEGEESNGQQGSGSKSHIFDGIQVHSKTGNFQLVDVHDSLSRALIDSREGVLSQCSPDANEGWYAFDYLNQIKQVVRRKFMACLFLSSSTSSSWSAEQEGQGTKGFNHDHDCDDLLGMELSKKSRLELDRDARASSRGGGTTTTRRHSSVRSHRNPNERQSSRLESEDDDDDDDEDDERSDVSTTTTDEEGRVDETGEVDRESQGDPRESATDSETGGEGSGSDKEATSTTMTTTTTLLSSTRLSTNDRDDRGSKQKKSNRAPWQLPRKKKRRPKEAESEGDMLARLQRKTRSSTTTGTPSRSAMNDRSHSLGTEGEGQEAE